MDKDILWVSDIAAEVTSGKVTKEWQATGISIDSRMVEKGDLFIALTTGVTDGHDYVKKAFEQGAAAVLVSEIPDDIDESYPLLLVGDTLQALNQMAVYKREKTNAKIIAITGSVGKTSVKEALAFVLSKQGRSHATIGNYNNYLGLPITLCRMADDVEYGVFELGMNHAGELSELSKMLKPHIAVITAIEAVHMEFFESLEKVAEAKSEVFEGLIKDKVGVIPYKSNRYDILLNQAVKYCDEVVSFAESYERGVFADYQFVRGDMSGEEIEFKLQAKGEHNAQNACAVLEVVKAAGADVKQAAINLFELEVPKGRGRVYDIAFGNKKIRLIDDSYNASPASMKAAIESLKSFEGRKVAVLGDMLELGEKSEEYHLELTPFIKKADVAAVYTSGGLMAKLYDNLPCEVSAKKCKTVDELMPILRDELQNGDVVLFKGSHGSNIYKIVEEFLCHAVE